MGAVYPLFVVPGRSVRRPVESMPGIFQLSVHEAVAEAKRAADLGVPAVLLFAAPAHKDSRWSAALIRVWCHSRLPQSSAYARSFSFGPMSACAARPITDGARSLASRRG